MQIQPRFPSRIDHCRNIYEKYTPKIYERDKSEMFQRVGGKRGDAETGGGGRCNKIRELVNNNIRTNIQGRRPIKIKTS